MKSRTWSWLGLRHPKSSSSSSSCCSCTSWWLLFYVFFLFYFYCSQDKKHKIEIPFSITVLLLLLFLCSIVFLFFLQDGKKKPQKASVKKRSFELLDNFNSLSVSRCVCVFSLSLSLHRFCNSLLQDIKYKIHQFWLIFSLPFFFPLCLSLCEKKNSPDNNQLLHVGG